MLLKKWEVTQMDRVKVRLLGEFMFERVSPGRVLDDG